MATNRLQAAARSERGVTLVVVLMVLLVVTVVGIGAARISLSGERSARFDRDYQVAFQSAESALMDAEADILTGSRQTTFRQDNFSDFPPGCGNDDALRGLCEPTATGAPIWFQVDFTDTTSASRTVEFGTYTNRIYANGTAGIQPAQAPRYIIEAIKSTTPGTDATAEKLSIIYRVTAMGFGPRPDIQAVVQTTFRKEE